MIRKEKNALLNHDWWPGQKSVHDEYGFPNYKLFLYVFTVTELLQIDLYRFLQIGFHILCKVCTKNSWWTFIQIREWPWLWIFLNATTKRRECKYLDRIMTENETWWCLWMCRPSNSSNGCLLNRPRKSISIDLKMIENVWDMTKEFFYLNPWNQRQQ